MDDVTRVLHVTVMQGMKKTAVGVLVRKSYLVQLSLTKQISVTLHLLMHAACTPGKYRSTPQNSSCVDCPANSDSPSAASESCNCNAGYYRVSGSEGIGVGCTGWNKFHTLLFYINYIPYLC